MGRTLLGLAVGGSFGVYVGALIASWVYGVEAIESEAVNASYLAAAVTIAGALAGAIVAYRTGRPVEEPLPDQVLRTGDSE